VGELDNLQTLGHLVPGFMFIGFLGIFSAITFAVARILGEFRKGGGEVQHAAGADVETVKMPGTARAMLLLMMIGMMLMGAGVVVNFLAAGSFDGSTAADVIDSAQYGAASAGLRRLGVVTFLTGIAFGLATIIEVLRFQALRIREVAIGHGHTH
jgi:multisubunit Na+/H+ antiporter MnhC subunit